MARLFGLRNYREITKTELLLFISKRQKLYEKFWAAEGLPPASGQISLGDAIMFIVESFGKNMQTAGSEALSFLYKANHKPTASIMGYNILYFVDRR